MEKKGLAIFLIFLLVFNLLIYFPDQVDAKQQLKIKPEDRIAAGSFFSLFLDDNGDVWHFGLDRDTELYYESEFDNYGHKPKPPEKIEGLSNIIAISAEYDHALALRKDGTVWAWGSNTYGQLGDGTKNFQSEPVQVKNLKDIAQIYAGNNISLALDQDGNVWTWGFNYYGDYRYVETITSPKKIDGLSNIIEFYSEGINSVALRADGTVWFWGSWYNLDETYTPTKVKNLSNIYSLNEILPKYKFDTNWNGEIVAETRKDVEATNFNIIDDNWEISIGLKKDGTVWGWGTGFGLFGNVEGYEFPNPIKIKNLNDIVYFDIGYRHAIALKSDGTVWTWGYSYFGELGNKIMDEGRDGTKVTGLPIATISYPPEIYYLLDLAMEDELSDYIFTWESINIEEEAARDFMKNWIVQLENLLHLNPGYLKQIYSLQYFDQAILEENMKESMYKLILPDNRETMEINKYGAELFQSISDWSSSETNDIQMSQLVTKTSYKYLDHLLSELQIYIFDETLPSSTKQSLVDLSKQFTFLKENVDTSIKFLKKTLVVVDYSTWAISEVFKINMLFDAQNTRYIEMKQFLDLVYADPDRDKEFQNSMLINGYEVMDRYNYAIENNKYLFAIEDLIDKTEETFINLTTAVTWDLAKVIPYLNNKSNTQMLLSSAYATFGIQEVAYDQYNTLLNTTVNNPTEKNIDDLRISGLMALRSSILIRDYIIDAYKNESENSDLVAKLEKQNEAAYKYLAKWTYAIPTNDPLNNPIDKDISILLNGKLQRYNQEPIVINGKTYLPLRELSETLGSTVDWNQYEQKITIKKDGLEVVLKVNSTNMIVNNTVYKIDAAPIIMNNKTMVPLRVVSEAFGLKVDWNNEANAILLSTE